MYQNSSKYTVSIMDLLIPFVARKLQKPIDEVALYPASLIVENGREYIFDFEYSFYSDEVKKEFEQLFLLNFFTHEIGRESVQTWRPSFMSSLLSNIARYEKLFESTLLEFDPLENTRVVEETTRVVDSVNSSTNSETTSANTETSSTSNASTEASSTSSNTSNATNENVQNTIFSDTPQSQLDGSDYATNKNNATVVGQSGSTSADIATNSQTVSGSDTETGSSSGASTGETASTGKNTETIRYEKSGNIGVMTYDQLLTGYRKSLLSVFPLIYDEMQDEFLKIY